MWFRVCEWGSPLPKKGAPLLPNFEINPLIFHEKGILANLISAGPLAPTKRNQTQTAYEGHSGLVFWLHTVNIRVLFAGGDLRFGLFPTFSDHQNLRQIPRNLHLYCIFMMKFRNVSQGRTSFIILGALEYPQAPFLVQYSLCLSWHWLVPR